MMYTIIARSATGEQPMTFKEWVKKLAEPNRWYEIVAVFDCHV